MSDLKAALCALRGEVVPWLLGHSDPVHERVAAHQGESRE